MLGRKTSLGLETLCAIDYASFDQQEAHAMALLMKSEYFSQSHDAQFDNWQIQSQSNGLWVQPNTLDSDNNGNTANTKPVLLVFM